MFFFCGEGSPRFVCHCGCFVVGWLGISFLLVLFSLARVAPFVTCLVCQIYTINDSSSAVQQEEGGECNANGDVLLASNNTVHINHSRCFLGFCVPF